MSSYRKAHKVGASRYRSDSKRKKKPSVPKVKTNFLDDRKSRLYVDPDRPMDDNDINWKTKLNSGFFEARALQTLQHTRSKVLQQINEFEYDDDFSDNEDYLESLKDSHSNIEYEEEHYSKRINWEDDSYQLSAQEWFDQKDQSQDWKNKETKRAIEEQRIINDLIMDDEFIDDNFFVRGYVYDDLEDNLNATYKKYKSIENELIGIKIKDADPDTMFATLRDLVFTNDDFKQVAEADFDEYNFENFSENVEDLIELSNLKFTEEDEDGIIYLETDNKLINQQDYSIKVMNKFYDDKDYLNMISKMLRIDVDKNLIISWTVDALKYKYNFVYIPSGGGKTNLFNKFKNETLDIDYMMKKLCGVNIDDGLKMLKDEYLDAIAYKKWNDLWKENVCRYKHFIEGRILLCHSPSQVPDELKIYQNGVSVNQLILLPTKLNRVRSFQENYYYLKGVKFKDDEKIKKYRVNHDMYFNIIAKFFGINSIKVRKKYDYYDVLKFRKENIYGNKDMHRNYDPNNNSS